MKSGRRGKSRYPYGEDLPARLSGGLESNYNSVTLFMVDRTIQAKPTILASVVSGFGKQLLAVVAHHSKISDTRLVKQICETTIFPSFLTLLV